MIFYYRIVYDVFMYTDGAFTSFIINELEVEMFWVFHTFVIYHKKMYIKKCIKNSKQWLDAF